MKRTVSLFALLALVFALFMGCTSPVSDPDPPAELVSIRVASLKGPTTMGMVGLLDEVAKGSAVGYGVESAIYGTPDEITGLLVNGQVDIAAIPANLAAVLFQKTEGAIQVAAINTLGVLYVVENGNSIQSVADLAGKTVYSTGKGNTPEFALNYVLSENGLDPDTDLTIEYKSEATEIAALLAQEGEGAIAVLPQPYVATVMAQNPDLRIALDLTAEWDAVSGGASRLVTGVVVVRTEFAQQHPDAVSAFLADYARSTEWVNNHPTEAATLIAELGIVPNAAIAEAALPYCSITFIQGDEMKNALLGYYQVLYGFNPQSIGGSLPNETFFYYVAP